MCTSKNYSVLSQRASVRLRQLTDGGWVFFVDERLVDLVYNVFMISKKSNSQPKIDSKKLNVNRIAWNKAAPRFYADTALPVWGPFDICKNRNFFGKIKNRTFLEIGFGSGHSVKYLVEKGAKKVYGIDISDKQYKFAADLNESYICKGIVELFHSNMEKKLNIPQVDFVYSIYAFGWSVNPEKVLKLIYSYLKPGGKFIWSWDHKFFSDLAVNELGQLYLKESYHAEKEKKLSKWAHTTAVYLFYRKTSTWFKLLKDAGFEIIEFLEPEPESKKDYTSNYYTLKKANLAPCSMVWVCQKPLK